MKINLKILSIPPYISTSWKNVVSLHLDPRDGDTVLVIGLVNGSTIEVPNLDRTSLESIFAAHQKFLEGDDVAPTMRKEPTPLEGIPNFQGAEQGAIMNIPLNFGFDIGMGMLQHNPEASDSPDLPKEVLEKIGTLSRAIDFGDKDQAPKPEPHCNCMHCQILKAIASQKETSEEVEEIEEAVSDDDLRFREWDIQQSEEHLYSVSNPLNKDERFNVFLGNPVGCTCGRENCEHIRAVLNS